MKKLLFFILLLTFLFLPGVVLSEEEDPVQLFQCILQLNQSHPVHRLTCDIDIQAKIKIPLLLPFTINLNGKLNLEENHREIEITHMPFFLRWVVETFIIKGPLSFHSFLSQEKWEDILSPFALAAEKVDSDRHYFWAARKEIIARYYHKNLEELEEEMIKKGVKKLVENWEELKEEVSLGEKEIAVQELWVMKLEVDNLGRVKKIFLANPTSRGEAEQEYASFKGYWVVKRTRGRAKYNSVNIDFQAQTRNYQLYP